MITSACTLTTQTIEECFLYSKYLVPHFLLLFEMKQKENDLSSMRI
jgi:hypothetical protein